MGSHHSDWLDSTRKISSMKLLLIFLLCALIVLVSVEGKKGKGQVSKGGKAKKPTKGKAAKGKVSKKPAKGKKPAKKPAKKPLEKPAKTPSKGKKSSKGKKTSKGKKGSKGKAKPKPVSEAQKELDAAYEEAKSLMERVEELEKELDAADAQINASRASSRHIIGNEFDQVAVLDATLSGYQTKCGNQVITGWSTNLNTFYKINTATAETTAPFTASTGIFTVPTGAKPGWYNICAFARFRNTGNSNDVVIRKSGSVIAAFGNADQSDWRSTGTCVIEYLSAGNEIKVQQESGGGSDCIEETGWYYARLMINNIATKNV